ncbi:MAG: phosphoribosylglycinamide formyltransferase [Ilumatobacteraceae bacterium]
MERSARLVLLASGNGSNVQAVIDACARGDIDAQVAAVVSDRHDARALERADLVGIPTVHVGKRADESRADYDARLADVVSGFCPDHVVLLGWMRVLTMNFLGWFPGMVINLHPALPGELAGTKAIERAFREFEDGHRDRTGVMVHLVPDEGVDSGPVLATEIVPIQAGDTLDSLTERVHAAEHRLVVSTLAQLCRATPRAQEIHA